MTGLDDAVRDLVWTCELEGAWWSSTVVEGVWHYEVNVTSSRQFRLRCNGSELSRHTSLEAAQLAARQHFLAAVERCLKEGYRVVKEGEDG